MALEKNFVEKILRFQKFASICIALNFSYCCISLIASEMVASCCATEPLVQCILNYHLSFIDAVVVQQSKKASLHSGKQDNHSNLSF